ncbi:MAG: OmpA family protein [Planctomycetes bacterium]|jgi:chemotaxis protein MotB|nr:OmpA family protein [Planctomycetota bacterium]
MTSSRFYGWILSLAIITLVAGGCGVSQQQYEDLQTQNRIQQNRLNELETALAQCNQSIQEKQRQIEALQGKTGADLEACQALNAALETDLEEKKALIAKLQAQLLEGGAPLPLELNVKLQEFAQTSDMIDFDEATGSLKFKSDLLFNLGSDEVQPTAVESLKTLAEIMNTPEAREFDLVIVGHTDDVPIRRAATRQAHPTNWHLSAHRAISVLNNLSKYGLEQERMAIKGYGEFRPVEPNRPNKGGNPANRRVEIFIVPRVR